MNFKLVSKINLETSSVRFFCLFLTGVTLLSTEYVFAGELFRANRTLAGNQNVRMRRISQSTKATRILNRGQPKTSVLSFNQSSPYEYRVIAYDKSVRKYERDYARWEQKVARIEERNEAKLIKDRKRDAEKAKRDKERQERLAKADRQKEEKRRVKSSSRGAAGGGSFFSRLFGGFSGKPAVAPEQSIIIDEKSQRAQSYFNKPLASEPPVVVEPQQQLGFWQRLKRALFGG